MARSTWTLVLAATITLEAAPVWAHPLVAKCPSDSVKVGDACVDRYEASVWLVPNPTTANRKYVNRILAGKITLANLLAAGATQLGATAAPWGLAPFPPSFPADGNWVPIAGTNPPTPGVYAVSIPGVLPTTALTWFQAQQACALSGKHLIRNHEWQVAAHGTPDPGTDDGATDCPVDDTKAALTGARSKCVSVWGAHDMVGNVMEWVADWIERHSFCEDWTVETGLPGNDLSCFGGDGSTSARRIPAGTLRGYSVLDQQNAGVLGITSAPLTTAGAFVGFRCAR